MKGKVKVQGCFHVQCFGPDGKLKWEDKAVNNVTTAGLNHILETEFRSGAQITAWYLILIGGTGTLAAADTLATHAGWTENNSYTGNRKAWSPGAAAAGAITNAAAVSYTITGGAATIKGCGVCSANTGTTGTLFCTALFTEGDRNVTTNDTLNVTYTLTASAV